MPSFTSTAIRRAEYDDRTETLRIWFVETGGPYVYHDVPRRLFERLCDAASKGRYFNDHIRDRFDVSVP
ncbi:KTSC domain-containing protein [Nannocystis punicea]|uniref:KTSC domain-containing protein n=1 Tax=Nannocystis punicea TaxID=2995304 RepID=A0ABY7H9C5_9BACT|nr:KTSC domain-containing protein [Nannocystis poenicansa]WAS95690.1 KTSC domain-containing protein [Nannocystis poenicansa]